MSLDAGEQRRCPSLNFEGRSVLPKADTALSKAESSFFCTVVVFSANSGKRLRIGTDIPVLDVSKRAQTLN